MMHVMNAHMMHALMHIKLVQFLTFSYNWLEQRVLTKNSKFWKTLVSNPNQIEKLDIILVRKHDIMN